MSEKECREDILKTDVCNTYLNELSKLRSYPINSEEQAKRWLKDQEQFEEDRFVRAVILRSKENQSVYLGKNGLVSSRDFMTIEGHRNLSKTLTVAQRDEAILSLKGEIEDVENTRNLIALFRSDTKKAEWEKTGLITRKMLSGNSDIWRIGDWDEHVTKVKGDEAVESFHKLMLEKILEVYA